MPTIDMPVCGKSFAVRNTTPAVLTLSIETYMKSELNPQKIVSKIESMSGDMENGRSRVTIALSGNVSGGFYNASLDCRAQPHPIVHSACELSIVQRGNLDIEMTDEDAIRNLKTSYADLFQKDDFAGVLSSIELLREALFDEKKRALKLALEKSSAAVGPVTDRGNMTVNKGDGSERVRFKTLIDSELPNTKAIFELVNEAVPVKDKPGMTVKKWHTKSSAHKYVANGKFTFVYKGGTFSAGKEVGHYWLAKGGGDVDFAGEVTFDDGAVTHWDNGSGHYIPHPALARIVPFPYDKFEPKHAGELAKKRRVEQERKERAEAALRYWNPIDEFLRNPENRQPNSRDTMRAAVARFRGPDRPDLSNRDVQDRMLSLGLVSDPKRMQWVNQ